MVTIIRTKEFEEAYLELLESCDYIVEEIEGNDFLQVTYVQSGGYCTDRIYENGNVYEK